MAALLAYNASADSAFISVPLQRTGVDTNAGGSMTINLGPTNSSMTLLASNLAPRRSYALILGGVVRGRFVADASGRGQLRFARPSQPGAAPFNFDPRGRQMALIENTRVVLKARISGPGEPRGSVVTEEVRLPRISGGGRADANFELLADGTRRLLVALTNVANGTYTVWVNGIRRGSMMVSNGAGAIAYDSLPATPERSLNFEPRGVVIDIAQGEVLRFSGKFQARSEGISAANPAVITRLLAPTGVSPTSVALVRRWVDRDARREVDVELYNVPVGVYELYINGNFRGFFPVIAAVFGTAGEMQFSTDPDDEDERLLDFDPFTSFYTVRGPDGTFFEGQPTTGATQITNVGMMPSEIEVPLFNLGIANGVARAQLKTDDRGRRHFEVEMRNVPAGDYSLLVNDIPFASIQVVSEPNGTRGVIEFEDEPELTEFLLNWEPRGQEIGIARGNTRYFERLFPAAPLPE